MEDEIIYEESKLSSRQKAFILLTIILVIAGAIIFFYQKNNFGVKKNITLEVGEVISTDVRNYLTNKPLNYKDYKLGLDNVPYDGEYKLTTIGEYTYRVTLKDTIKEGKIIVKDTKAPVVTTMDLTVGVNEELNADDFIATCDDFSLPCTNTIEGNADTSKAGSFEIVIKSMDQEGNATTNKAHVTVKENYSLKEAKSKDLTPKYLEPSYDDWNNQYVVKFSGGLDPDDEDNYRWQYYYDFLESNYEDYLDANNKGKTIKSSEIMAVYNQYHYIIGFACRATLSDGKITYLTNGE